jgi:hypothetical protein
MFLPHSEIEQTLCTVFTAFFVGDEAGVLLLLLLCYFKVPRPGLADALLNKSS